MEWEPSWVDEAKITASVMVEEFFKKREAGEEVLGFKEEAQRLCKTKVSILYSQSIFVVMIT